MKNRIETYVLFYYLEIKNNYISLINYDLPLVKYNSTNVQLVFRYALIYYFISFKNS